MSNGIYPAPALSLITAAMNKRVQHAALDRERPAMKTALLLTTCLLVSACSAQQGYYTGQAWQRQDCGKYINKTDHDTCLQRASGSYEDYRRKTRQ